jgi:hypothetical protein
MGNNFEKDITRAEFLKKSSPIANKKMEVVTPPPLFSESEKISILGDTNLVVKEKKQIDLGKLVFWKNWKDKQYTFASVGLAIMLIGYVGISVAGLGINDVSLNATLTVPESTEENAEETTSDDRQIIESEVVDSSIVIEDIKKDSSIEESEDITEYIFENYDI